jgi:hypothetical protein
VTPPTSDSSVRNPDRIKARACASSGSPLVRAIRFGMALSTCVL